MRLAVFSDIHGNCVAFNAMLADLHQRPTDQMVCLGDAIQGGPQPAEVVARLRELACPVVMGNADDWLLTGQDSGAEAIDDARRQNMEDVRLWALDQLTDADQSFITAFQPTVSIPLEADRAFLGFHGSPQSFDDVILPTTPDDDLRRMLGAFSPNILAGGHTHVQQIRQQGDSFYFGCGSVGFAYRHDQPEDAFHADPWAEYAILTAEAGTTSLEFRRVPFDVDALIRVYNTSGRPHADGAIAQYQR